MILRYSLLIRWSDEDNAFLVSLPELYGEGRYATHGDTYEDALRNGLEVMELLAESLTEGGQALPDHRPTGSPLARARMPWKA